MEKTKITLIKENLIIIAGILWLLREEIEVIKNLRGKIGLDIILLPSGAIIGWKIIDWVKLPKEVKTNLLFYLLPLSLFILTSSSATLAKALVIFLNVKLIKEKLLYGTKNKT